MRERSEVCEAGIVALDDQHGVPRLDPVALVERVHLQGGEVVAAQLEQGDRLVDPAQPPAALGGQLPRDACGASLGAQRATAAVEVGVAVETGADLLHRQRELRRIDPLASSCSHRWRAPISRRAPQR